VIEAACALGSRVSRLILHNARIIVQATSEPLEHWRLVGCLYQSLSFSYFWGVPHEKPAIAPMPPIQRLIDNARQRIRIALSRVSVHAAARTDGGTAQQQLARVAVVSLMHGGVLGRGVKVAHPPLQRRGLI
jgi:hypothetical protein